MNDSNTDAGGRAEAEGGEEREVRTLLEKAGPRAGMPAADFERIRAAARSEWRLAVDRRARRTRTLRYWIPALAAAGLALVAGLYFGRGVRAPVPPAVVATVELAEGAILASAPGVPERAVSVGASLVSGTVVELAAGEVSTRLALRAAGGGSIRLAAGTRVRLGAANRLELERGAVYVDSASSGAGGALEITTLLGGIREIGTQFEVRLVDRAGSALEIRVREGRVALDRESGSVPVVAGEMLTVGAEGADLRRSIARTGADWDWVLEAAPAIEIEGRTLRSFLDWAAREAGWELRFEAPELERLAESVRLHGGVEGLRPDQAVGIILDGAGLDHEVEAGVLSIRTRR